MSKIGKKGIETENICELKNKSTLIIKKNIKYKINKPFYFKLKKKKIFVKIKKKYRHINKLKSMWGTHRANIRNNILGQKRKFKKTMKVEGVGYYIIEKKTGILEINSGYSHVINFKLNKNIKYNIKNNIIKLKCHNKSMLGLTCSLIKKQFKKSPYKKKGIFYINEKVLLKVKKKK